MGRLYKKKRVNTGNVPIDTGDTKACGWLHSNLSFFSAWVVCLTSSSFCLHNPCNHSWLILTKPLLFLKLWNSVSGGGVPSTQTPGDKSKVTIAIITIIEWLPPGGICHLKRHVCACCWHDEQCVALRALTCLFTWRGLVMPLFSLSELRPLRSWWQSEVAAVCRSPQPGEVSKSPPLASAGLWPLAPPAGFDWIGVCEQHRGRCLFRLSISILELGRFAKLGQIYFARRGCRDAQRCNRIKRSVSYRCNKFAQAAKRTCGILVWDISQWITGRTVSTSPQS